MLRRFLFTGVVCSSALASYAAAQELRMQPVQAQRMEVQRPAELQIEAPANSVVLRAQSTDALLEQRQVQRRMSVQQVRAQPVIQLEQGEADLRPVLNNPAAPINVAQRLRARPQIATVRADTLEVAEIPEGLVVRQFIAYQLEPGACSTPSGRRAVAAQGAECWTRQSNTRRASSFANPQASARYIANPSERSRAIAEANTIAAEQQAEIDADIAQLRQYLADPSRRADIGEAEATRLSALSDEALQEELINRAEIEVEEVMFVPNLEAQDLRIRARPAFGTSERPRRQSFELADVSVEREEADARILAAGGTAPESSLPPAHRQGPTDLRTSPTRPQGMTDFQAAPQLDISENIAVDREFYLTGFTLGRQHEWRKRVSITVAWCIWGCKKTYYVEPYAGFGYGFGLRFPVRMDGTYEYRHKNGQERAFFRPVFQPVNANTNQYSRTGLANHQLFSGQELVAEANAYAGVLYKLTHNRSGNFGVEVGTDLTDRLPSPFTNGQFKPPSPGQTTPPVIRTIEQVDFLANRASFGIVGAKIHPAVKMELFSNGLSFRLRDHVANNTITMSESGKRYPLEVNNNRFSRFRVSDPVYNLGFQMTPGLVGRAYVDIAVWSRNWDWPVWFPQLKVQLPPNGVNFTCHAGTVCGHEYKLKADYWRPKPRRTSITRPVRTNPPPARTSPSSDPQRANPPRQTTPEKTSPSRDLAPS
ncbi:hypothetical protein [Altererythrobacter lutimaris]|uniref:Uncharacterized protein n=1 Tax=Altererythrobacter lutimaris TaxID=2743979 RepID=A0A850HHW5_9SPHN|nr:hypothetical protein [Altererythrobacter lutimaris]NVE94912.1 hypothetical protein [Altererythrobacter lutimaris]